MRSEGVWYSFSVMKPPASMLAPGPFRADQIRSGDPYELSNGHALRCMPTGGRGARANLVGAAVLGSDPAVESAGIDAGFSPSPETLRAPDIAVGGVPEGPGWIRGVPPLAVEYADSGQDEAELAEKITELLAAGTQIIWVVRLVGPRRVEIHTPGEPLRLAQPGDELTAPGILANPVPVEALYDAEAGYRVTLRNLLQREGYGSLDEVRAEGAAEGEAKALRQGIREILASRGLEAGAVVSEKLEQCADLETLRLGFRRALTAPSADAILSDF
jgi:hypothetical protein